MRHVVIHGHYYQPPREDPWLELVPHELSAAPDHDWNARITRQCYAPLARARVVDAQGRVTRLINTYAWCSFDIGPSLFRWFDAHEPWISAAIVAGDQEAIARTGHGNAIAMPYHHAILPLMSSRDKRTEIAWGIREFQARFSRDPVGIWLPETAADDDTLAVVADAGIRFTLLAPNQVHNAPGGAIPGRWRSGTRELAIFTYDGSASHHVAFGGALDDVNAWEQALAPVDAAGDSAVIIATDGETFGHHHRMGDLALASLIDRLGRRPDAAMTNLESLLAANPPSRDVQLVSPSSWSCPHGVDRWRRACGCHFEPHTSQEWRAPLRHGLDELASGITTVLEREWPASAGDLWHARNAAGPDLRGIAALPDTALVLLEAAQHALAMFTSCAWFFDDIGRLEPRIVLRHAARAIELLPIADRASLEAALRATLEHAHSNDATKGSGAAIWRRDVLPDAAGPAHLAGALAALRELAPAALDDVVMPAHDCSTDADDIVLVHRRTGERSQWTVSPDVRGVFSTRVTVRNRTTGVESIVGVAAFPEPVRSLLRDLATPIVLDATLSLADRSALVSGLLDRAALLDRALASAWLLVQRDGVDAAGIVVHGVLDLFDLDGTMLTDAQMSDAFVHLAAAPAGDARNALAARIGVAA